MPAFEVTIEMRRGETLEDRRFRFFDADGTTPLNMTGASYALVVAEAYGATPVLSLSGAGIGADAVNGACWPIITPSASYALAEGDFVFELWTTFASGARHPTHRGAWRIRGALVAAPP